MTDEELIKRLRDPRHVAQRDTWESLWRTTVSAANRIEELLRERDEAKAMQECGCAYDTPTDICMGHHALFERVYAMRQGKP
jgi:hypothetical protein